MADYVKRIRTSEGDLQIDYKSLANLPDLSSLSAGALPLSGGTMTGDINFGNAANLGLQWTTNDGTRIRIRPYSPSNLFQITMKSSGGDEFGALNISTAGDVTFKNPIGINVGGTGATDAATARNNLGVPYYAKYESGNIQMGASNTSAWLTYYGDDGTNYNQMDMTKTGTTFTKPVTISSGGTGATTAANALANLGALPTTGGDMTGSINFGSGTRGLVWTTEDGTVFSLRPYYGGNLFQITRRPPNGIEVGAFSIDKDGNVGLGSIPLNIANGGTGASDAATARTNLGAAASGHGHTLTDLSGTLSIEKGGTGATTARAALSNLGIIYSSNIPSYVDGAIWLKPV